MSIFDSIRISNPKYNSFSMDHTQLFSTESGSIYPFCPIEVVPGDKLRVRPSMFFRLAPLATPLFQDMTAYIRSFYVPYRICWDKWQEFIGEPKVKGNPRPLMPVIDCESLIRKVDAYECFWPGSLLDAFGYPCDPLTYDENGNPQPPVYNGVKYISALPFLAYQLVYNEYFLNEVTEDPNDLALIIDHISQGNGQVLTDAFAKKLLTIRNANWRKDYFTACLDTVNGNQNVLIPMQGDVDIQYDYNQTHGEPDKLHYSSDGTLVESSPLNLKNNAQGELTQNGSDGVNIEPKGLHGIFRNAMTTVQDLRVAFSTQKILELSARVGRRYKEQIFGFFGVDVKDSRVDRPEYLGGVKIPIQVNDVTQTVNTDDDPLGTLAGKGLGAGSFQVDYTVAEHGIFFCVLYMVPRAMYGQGVRKMLKRFDKYDFYFPQFAHLGEQAVLNEELYATADGRNKDVFGYTPRYSEYKWLPNTFHGAFKSVLKNWHLGRWFANRPYLNEQFTKFTYDEGCRVFAYNNEFVSGGSNVDKQTDPNLQHYWVQCFNEVAMSRKMPYYGTPMTCDCSVNAD